ncbi:hypothetical protein AB4Y38_41465 [Paraburkholderia sp. EG285A]|uniref:hypothetical protein n=1 Tax=Paraburkholderia sp. EG285A TaxID=3237009 RepID=UPI0034D341CF
MSGNASSSPRSLATLASWAWGLCSALIVGPALMLFAFLAFDSGFSFRNLASDYYSVAALETTRPATPGFISIAACPGISAPLQALSACPDVQLILVPVSKLESVMAARLRFLYAVAVVVSAFVVGAYRLLRRALAGVPGACSWPPVEERDSAFSFSGSVPPVTADRKQVSGAVTFASGTRPGALNYRYRDTPGK